VCREEGVGRVPVRAETVWRYLGERPRIKFRTWLGSETGWPMSRRASASCLSRAVY